MLGYCLASGPLILLIAVRPLASCLPDSASGSFFLIPQRVFRIEPSNSTSIPSRTFVLQYENHHFSEHQMCSVYVGCSRRLGDAMLLPFRLSKTLLEDVWDALRLLSGLVRMSFGALGSLLGSSWLVLASLLLLFELVLIA